jgi:hypothetical protein
LTDVVKNQLYYILKFNSSRLKKYNYNINITLKEARKNQELVSIGDSQLLRSIRLLKNNNITDKFYIDSLFLEKQKLKSKKSSFENSQRIIALENEIDGILFIPEIISIVIQNNRHYEHIINDGLIINNYNYKRLLCGAGHSRRNTVLFIREDFEKPLKQLLNNDRNKNIEISSAKFNAYFALSSSATYQVSEPSGFAIIPDCEINRLEQVDFIEEIPNEDDKIEEKEMKLPFNLFDGQGIISPKQAITWSDNLGLGYIPSAFIIRNIFLKGMVCVFDFHEFAKKYNKYIIKDVWDNDIDIRTINAIFTASQFKLWNAYDSCEDYKTKCIKNRNFWGVSRYTPREDNKFAFTNYQFLQALNLNDNQIKDLCSKTIEYFNKTIINDIDYTLLYLLGKAANNGYKPDIFDEIKDNVTQSLLLHNDLINDPYIQNYIIHSLNKKIKESYIGNLLLDGNYQIMIDDPVAFTQHALGLPVNGLLQRNEYYNTYWNDIGIKQVSAMRAPLTWQSEVNKLNLKRNKETEYWYKWIRSGIIYNIHGVDHMLHGGSDCDGDLVFTSNCQEILDGCKSGNPIAYETRKTSKKIIIEEELYKADLKSFNTKIGFITNVSTTAYSMLPLYHKNSKEYNELIRRLKQCRKEQGAQIDKAKGLLIKEFPKYWTNYTKITDNMGDEEKEIAKFNNSILIDRRPYFMRYLYSGYNKKYLKFVSNYDNYCISNFGYDLKELFNKEELNIKEYRTIQDFYNHSPLLDSECLVNRICHYMESQMKEIKFLTKHKITDENILILKDHDIELNKEKLKKLYNIYKKFKSEKRNFANIKDSEGNERYKTIDQYNKSIRQECYNISSNISELANLAISICYEIHPNDNKQFCWSVFGEGIIANIKKNRQDKILVPFLSDDGDIEYLGNKYKRYEIEVN